MIGGHCGKLAYDFAHVNGGRIVHVVLKDTETWHAWVEKGGYTYDLTKPEFSRRFPTHLNPPVTARFGYSPKRAKRLALKWGTFGPWERELVELQKRHGLYTEFGKQ